MEKSDAGLTTIAWRGDVSRDELIPEIMRAVDSIHTPTVLWDFSAATSVKLTTNEIRNVVKTAWDRGGARLIDVKTAVVVPGDLLFGMARQAQSFLAMINPKSLLEVFREQSSALAWLGVSQRMKVI